MTIPRGFITDYIVVSRNTAALIIFFERRCLWHCAAGFLRISGAMCSLTFYFASARIRRFLAFTRKYLLQFRVSILWNKTPAQAFTPPADENKMGTIWIFVYYGSGRGRCRDFLGGGS